MTRDRTRITGKSLSAVKRELVKPTFRPSDVIMNAQSTHKCWFILESAVFGLNLSLLPLVDEGGGLVCESVGSSAVGSF